MLTPAKRQAVRDGIVIPAHPLALTVDLQLDEAAQRGLTRHYRDAGVGGLAVGVHTTQFEIRAAGLYERVLQLAIDESTDTMVMVAGVLGPTRQAVGEATLARDLGYDLALVATPGWGEAGDAEILAGVARVAEVMPVCGFYIQPAIGNRRFGFDFWRAYAQIDGVVAIKIAPFDRYATIDVVRAVVEAGRARDIALYTGNDDNIIVDLLTPFRFGDEVVHIVGGLLGQWAIGAAAAVRLHAEIRELVRRGGPIPFELLTRAAELTDLNSAAFDPAHRFAGSIAGVNEILARQGLLAGNWCLSEHERLSPGQAAEIDRTLAAYPWVAGFR